MLTISEIGTTDSAGFVILASPSTSSSEWASQKKQMYTWTLSVNASENLDLKKGHCLSCSRFAEKLKFQKLSSSKSS
jgi:hypothetical protein